MYIVIVNISTLHSGDYVQLEGPLSELKRIIITFTGSSVPYFPINTDERQVTSTTQDCISRCCFISALLLCLLCILSTSLPVYFGLSALKHSLLAQNEADERPSSHKIE